MKPANVEYRAASRDASINLESDVNTKASLNSL